MRIKKIEVEGFKSYSQCEIVERLDAQFNAITGLNGSGKSNILDAICFLLGITNLANVRAHSLTDLVYKQGQAGINRATVTIVFDNDVPADQQPAGYNKHKEIVVRRQTIINGRNTYQINGTAATNQRVSDLFRMVGINVNNPHFLIMQGRITKVLNMKPMEILSMVEEAAGVRMYECKKISAMKTIEKREAKVNEISRLIDEDILPRVDKLKKDRANYLEYQQIERELEELQRKLYAYDYYNSKLQVRELEKREQTIRQEIQQIGENLEELQDRLKSEQAELRKMEAEKAKHIGPELKNLERDLKQLQNEHTKIESERDTKEAALAELRTAADRKRKSLESDQKHLEKKRKQLTHTESDSGSEEQRGKAAEEAVVRARQKLEALARGMTTDEEGNAITLEAQLTATRTKYSERQTNVKKADLQRGQQQKLLDKKRTELQQMARRSHGNEEAKRQLEEEIAQIENRVNELNFDPTMERRLDEERRSLEQERQRIVRDLDQSEARYYNLQFNYRDPEPGFNRSKVKGVVAKLFRLKDPKFATALEVVAGGRIYNIVVDKAETASLLLARKCSQNRVTMLPLDKIEARGVLNQKQIHEARRMVGAENVFVPRELIEYEPELTPIIDYVFGSSLICTNMEHANQLTYKNQNVNCRTVTLTGEDFNPRGVLTGGSRNTKASMLQTLFENSASHERVVAIERRIQAINEEFVAMRPLAQRFEEWQHRLTEKRNRLNAVNEAIKLSPIEMLREEIAQLEAQITEASEVIQTDGREVEALGKRIRELEAQKKDEHYQEKEKKKAEKELTTAQRELEQLKGTFGKAKEVLASLREEIAALEQSISDDRDELDAMTRRMEEKRAEVEQISVRLADANEYVKKSQQELDKYNKEIRQHDKTIRAKAAEIEDMKKQTRQLENRQQSKEKDAQEANKNSADFAKRAQQLKKVHKWIEEEKHKFGTEDSVYDFRGYNYEIGKKEIESRKDRSKELEQTINTKAMHLLDTAEERFAELEMKREQLVKDKQLLYDTIKQLDDKKRSELLIAHKQISADFCAIYSTLLPGASAELIPPSGAENCLSGLEVRVAFNGKYKVRNHLSAKMCIDMTLLQFLDSLAELSGGQRSLVALSLILAMLKFKPAPFYILDEIDAALDISHTENIGKMIKHHFSQSQFIVVSLKQGFFDNANVVYRVQFKDGRSVISRTENKH